MERVRCHLSGAGGFGKLFSLSVLEDPQDFGGVSEGNDVIGVRSEVRYRQGKS